MGWNPLGDLQNTIHEAGNSLGVTGFQYDTKDPLSAARSVLASALTGGLLDYQGGKFTQGFAIRDTQEWIGELSGRNAARHQTALNQEAIDANQAVQQQQILNEQKRKETQDVQASQAAGTARSGTQGGYQQTITGSSFYNPTRDFLGL
jgi:hypothetical protein